MGEDELGVAPGEKSRIPRYSKLPLGVGLSIPSMSPRIVFRSSTIPSLHSAASASNLCTSLHVSLCFSKNQLGIWFSQIRQRIGVADIVLKTGKCVDEGRASVRRRWSWGTALRAANTPPARLKTTTSSSSSSSSSSGYRTSGTGAGLITHIVCEGIWSTRSSMSIPDPSIFL